MSGWDIAWLIGAPLAVAAGILLARAEQRRRVARANAEIAAFGAWIEHEYANHREPRDDLTVKGWARD